MIGICQCGCGTEFNNVGSRGRPLKYLPEHRRVGQGISRRKNLPLPERKTCAKCLIEKDAKDFGVREEERFSGGTHSYLKSRCKACDSEEQRNRKTVGGLPKLTYKQKLRERKRNDIRFYISEKISQWRKITPGSDLTTDYLVELWNGQEGKCYYTGVQLIFNRYVGKILPDHISLDRKDPGLGYTKGNVVWCSYLSNSMKQNLTVEGFMDMIKTILARLEKK